MNRKRQYTLSVERVVDCKYAKRSLFSKFFQLADYVMLTWEKIPGSPRFSVLQATESWVRPGNEAKKTSRYVKFVHPTCLFYIIKFLCGVKKSNNLSTRTYFSMGPQKWFKWVSKLHCHKSKRFDFDHQTVLLVSGWC